MRLIVEFEGIVVDLRSVWYEVYRDAAEAVGWSRVDEATFWRLTRKDGSNAAVLPTARPVKYKEYTAQFDERIERTETIERYAVRDKVPEVMRRIRRHGAVSLVTFGTNVLARRAVVAGRNLDGRVEPCESLNADPRRRPAELRALCGGDRRTIVVATTDSLLRAAGSAELFSVGMARGACSVRRLHQAGADVVLDDLADLADSLDNGATALIQAGLLPASLG